MGTFALDISKWIEKAKGRETIVVRKVALDIFRRVILRTPVDTGRARGNWQCAIEDIPTAALATVDPDGGATVASAADIVQSMKAGDRIFLVNNVVYILSLEDGHSKQAPAGMVGITLTEFGAVVDQAVDEAKSA